MTLEENVKLGMLLDTYGQLLSAKQYQMLYDFVNSDMSLGEIAQNCKVSRSAVLDAINKAKQKLLAYEQKLKLCKLKHDLVVASNSDDCKNQIKKLLEEM